jgi:hypothetical protein
VIERQYFLKLTNKRQNIKQILIFYQNESELTGLKITYDVRSHLHGVSCDTDKVYAVSVLRGERRGK